MFLTAGTRIGPYEIAAQIGAGGMGEVYRATDTNLKRQVAIKILPDGVAADRERLARFQREAELLASLNHPNIATVHGWEKSAGMTALVMELVEGPTLADRIAEGPIPVNDALPIAKQIAEALEAAHEQGVIHRDVKPANIKITRDGDVKVLDFGLAKPLDRAPAGDASQSPTISSPVMTRAGVIVGTAAYMSPEQARGKSVDKRTDIWAFGCVVYEILTGRAAFPGETLPDTIAAVLDREPDWSALPAGTAAGIGQLLRRCLEKDPKHRLRDIGDARIEIDEALTIPSGDGRSATIPGVHAARWQRALLWAIAFGGAALAAAVLLAPGTLRRPAPPRAALRLKADLGADASLAYAGYGPAAILSPDDVLLAFVAQRSTGGNRQLYVRRLTQLQAMALSGTEDADSPFFSPDGQWIAFFAGGKLKKISVTGGAVVTLCDAADGRGGAWSEDGTIIFSPNSGSGVSLRRVSSAGGMAEPATSLATDEVSQRWPQVLPGGKAVLFTSSSSPVAYDEANLVVQPLPTGARKVVQRGGYYGRYVPSGHLVYLHDGSLLAVPFDVSRLEVTGQPVVALDSVGSNPVSGGAQFEVSSSGTLMYVPGQTFSDPPYWLDRNGKTTPMRATLENWFNPQFAPDGRHLAMNVADGQNDVWVYEWARDLLNRLTFDPADDRKPVWTPDGRRIVFASTRADKSTMNLYWRRSDGTGDEQRLTVSRNPQFPASWHPSGKLLAFEEQNPQTNFDLMILPVEGDEMSGWKPGEPRVFLNSPFAEREPVFSFDGRWLAYWSNETGRNEVYVQSFPGPGGKWQISTGSGTYPTWSRTKHELFYGTAGGQIMVAPYTVEGDSFRAETPRLWSGEHFAARGPNRAFDLHPDGERFVLARAARTQSSRKDGVTFVFNFFDELRRLAPATKR